MYKGKRVTVVVPAHNEEALIAATLAGIPDYVDSVIVVDDASTDRSAEIARELAATESRISVLEHEQNQGVGGTVVDGYKSAVEQGSDIAVVMAGDNQMDPGCLPQLLDKITDDGYDAAKGNRFLGSSSSLSKMPKYRQFGNILLTIMTKAASGYWSLFDSQNGYYAVTTDTLRRLDLDRVARRYDLENSILIQMNIIGARVADVAIPARYGEEVSGIRLWRVAPRLLLTLFFGFFLRIYRKYVLYNFHPIALFLYSGLVLMAWGIAFGAWAAVQSIGEDAASTGTVMLAVLPFLMGFQLMLSAIVLDIQNEPK
jgi:glycosyltransferase involved in cell wall biosynthesis